MIKTFHSFYSFHCFRTIFQQQKKKTNQKRISLCVFLFEKFYMNISIGELTFLFDIQSNFCRLITFHSHIHSYILENILKKKKEILEIETLHHLHNIPNEQTYFYPIVEIHNFHLPSDYINLTSYYDFIQYSNLYIDFDQAKQIGGLPLSGEKPNDSTIISIVQNYLKKLNDTKISTLTNYSFKEIYVAYSKIQEQNRQIKISQKTSSILPLEIQRINKSFQNDLMNFYAISKNAITKIETILKEESATKKTTVSKESKEEIEKKNKKLQNFLPFLLFSRIA